MADVHILTQEDLDSNPKYGANGWKVGDAVDLNQYNGAVSGGEIPDKDWKGEPVNGNTTGPSGANIHGVGENNEAGEAKSPEDGGTTTTPQVNESADSQ